MLVLIKHKILELDPQCKLKQREIIRHGTHPFRRYGRVISRCLTLLWKSACDHPDVLEFISMSALKHKVAAWRVQFPGMAWLFAELDLVEMFPNIDRPSVPIAPIFFFDSLCNSKGLCPRNTRFWIHKGGVKTLDHVACNGSKTGYYKLGFVDILHYVFWDLLFNDMFVSCSSVFRQTCGIAIGGSSSAQFSSLVVAYKERVLKDKNLPPMVRYRDNFLVLLLTSLAHTDPHVTVQRVADTLHETLGMELTVECISGVLPFLEANLFVSSSHDVEISVKPPVFHCGPGASHPASHQRMLDHFSPNTPPMLASFVPNQVLKAMHYAFGSEIIFFNICCLMLLLTSKQYPASWWKPTILAKCDAVGYGDLARSALRFYA